MKRFGLTAIAASAMLAASVPAFAQQATTTCGPGEGMVLQYDIRYNKDVGLYEFIGAPRLAFSDCAEGKSTSVTFRGVSTDLQTTKNVMDAIEAADLLTKIGLTDPAEIKKLLDRVAAAKEANTKKAQVGESKQPKK